MMKSKIILRILLLISFVAIVANFIYVIGDFNKQVTDYEAKHVFISIMILLNCLFFVWTFAKKSKPNAFMYGVLILFLITNLMVPSYKITTLTVGGAHASMSDAVEDTKSKNIYGLNSIVK